MTMPSRLHDPPRLRTLDDEDERHATWLELFFDLVFVVAVAQLADGLAADPSVHGFLVFAGLFVPVWWAWVGYTFYADRFDTDDRLHRILMIAGMFGVAVLATVDPRCLPRRDRRLRAGLRRRPRDRRPPERSRLVAPARRAAAAERLHPGLHGERSSVRALGGCRAAGSLLALGCRAGRRSRHAAREPGPDQAGADPRLPHPGARRPASRSSSSGRACSPWSWGRPA